MGPASVIMPRSTSGGQGPALIAKEPVHGGWGNGIGRARDNGRDLGRLKAGPFGREREFEQIQNTIMQVLGQSVLNKHKRGVTLGLRDGLMVVRGASQPEPWGKVEGGVRETISEKSELTNPGEITDNHGGERASKVARAIHKSQQSGRSVTKQPGKEGKAANA